MLAKRTLRVETLRHVLCIGLLLPEHTSTVLGLALGTEMALCGILLTLSERIHSVLLTLGERIDASTLHAFIKCLDRKSLTLIMALSNWEEIQGLSLLFLER